MRVTIITDASYCGETKACGYAFWIASSRGKMGGSGTPKSKPANSMEAEMMSMLNSLAVAARVGLVQRGDVVLVQNDCIPAMQNLRGQHGKNGPTDLVLEMCDWLKMFIDEQEVTVKFRHVKGHCNKRDPRYLTNNICDRRAKIEMRRQRSRFKIAEIKEFLNGS